MHTHYLILHSKSNPLPLHLLDAIGVFKKKRASSVLSGTKVEPIVSACSSLPAIPWLFEKFSSTVFPASRFLFMSPFLATSSPLFVLASSSFMVFSASSLLTRTFIYTDTTNKGTHIASNNAANSYNPIESTTGEITKVNVATATNSKELTLPTCLGPNLLNVYVKVVPNRVGRNTVNAAMATNCN